MNIHNAMVHLEGVHSATFQVGFDSWKVSQEDTINFHDDVVRKPYS